MPGCLLKAPPPNTVGLRLGASAPEYWGRGSQSSLLQPWPETSFWSLLWLNQALLAIAVALMRGVAHRQPRSRVQSGFLLPRVLTSSWLPHWSCTFTRDTLRAGAGVQCGSW